MTESTVTLPLNGIVVLDFTHVWSGPSATRLLAGMGAEVIKIEGPKYPDFLRGTGSADVKSRYPDETYGPDPWNRNAWFNTVNTDKSNVVVDLKHPGGIDIILRLVEQTHLVIANFRPGVLERMGLGFSQLRSRRPDISLIEMTGYGSTGPMAGMQAYGAQFDAMSGSAFLTGDGQEPLLTGFALSDPVAGLAAASAATTVIEHWRRTGQGSNVEVIQRDAMVPMHGEYLLAASRGESPEEGLNEDESIPLQGMFAAGDGMWIALSIYDQQSWSALQSIVDDETRRLLENLQCIERAREEKDRVHAIVAEWVLRQPNTHILARHLQQNGLAAAPVKTAAELYEDSDYIETGFFGELVHPSAGRHRYPGLPLTIDGKRCAPRSPAPTFDADTDEILSRRLKIPDYELRRLREDGVIGGSLSIDAQEVQ